MRDELLRADALPDDVEGELVTGALVGEEAGLRPRRLDDFVGQAELKEHLAIILEAARRRGQAADHLLFAGPPGLGKTTMAGIVAAEMEVALHVTSGPALERAGDLAAILSALDDGDVLFIDEIHRLPRSVEEVLYPAMEDFQLDIVLGKGPAARSIRLDVPRFTLVGATTRTGLITGPLRDRFGLVARLDYYEPGDLRAIVERAADILGVTIDAEGAAEIAGRARGTPRIANRLLRRVRDFAEVAVRRHRRPRRRPVRPGHLRRRRAGPRQGRPGHPRPALRALRRGAGRPLHPRHRGGRAGRDGRGRLRALPDPPRACSCAPPAGGSPPRRRGPTWDWARPPTPPAPRRRPTCSADRGHRRIGGRRLGGASRRPT